MMSSTSLMMTVAALVALELADNKSFSTLHLSLQNQILLGFVPQSNLQVNSINPSHFYWFSVYSRMVYYRLKY